MQASYPPCRPADLGAQLRRVDDLDIGPRASMPSAAEVERNARNNRMRAR